MSNSKCVYYKEKEQKSTDGGITWVDTGNFRKGALISTQASQCGSFVTEYRWTKADYVCDNANKYKGYKQQVSYDNGGSWTDTGVVDIGSLIESNSKDCGYDERWFVLTGVNDFICDGASKYKKKEMKYTRDSGTTWNSFVPPKYEKGDLIEETSTDCAIPAMKVTYTDGTTKYFANLTTIAGGTIPNIENAKEVEIYNSIIVIGDYAFESSKITGITIPDSVISIGNQAFWNCRSLTGITIPNSVTSIGIGAFGRCSDLTGITIPNSVISIGNGAFSYCTNLTSVTLPDGLRQISDSLFMECINLESVTIPDIVASIGNDAFNNCEKLTGITIPNSVTKIGADAFNGCSSLRRLTVNATTPPTLGSDAFANSGIQRIYVPAESLDAYKTANGWKDYADKIWAIGYDEQWFVMTGDKDFICEEGSKYKKKEMKYTRDSGTTWNSFNPPKYEKGDLIAQTSSDCTGDTGTTTGSTTGSMKVTYTDGTTKYFTGLTSIQLHTVPNEANAKEVIIYDGVTEIGKHAFDDCLSLTGITIPNSVEIIDKGAFWGCEELVSIILPNGLRRINDNTFTSCSSLKYITIPNSVNNIGYQAFSKCYSLTDITIPDSVLGIDYGSFEYCFSLKTMTVNATNPPQLGRDAIPNNIQTIYVPSSSVNSYKSADGWKDYASKIQAIP